MLDRCLEEEHTTMLKDLSSMVTRLLKMPNMTQPHLRYFSPARNINEARLEVIMFNHAD